MTDKSLLWVLMLIFLCACKSENNKPPTPQPDNSSSLHLIGQVRVPRNYAFQGTTVGGLSSIDHRPDNQTYYLMYDDPSDQQPARYYTAKLTFDDKSFSAVNFTGVVTLQQPDGTPFPNAATDPGQVLDPEGIVYNPLNQTLIWSSEGARQPGANPPQLIDPCIREMNPDGSYVAEFILPDLYKMKASEKGPRLNGVFEGLSVSPDGKFLYASLEEPLYEDGPRADVDGPNALIRMLKFDAKTHALLAQFAYPLEKVHAAPNPANQFRLNGVVEIVTVSENRLLVMERSFALGASPDYAVKLFDVDLTTATDVSGITALAGASFTPASKKLLLNVGTAGVSRVDNLEGMTFGPLLPNGHRSLILVSDDNYNPLQITQFLVFEVLP